MMMLCSSLLLATLQLMVKGAFALKETRVVKDIVLFILLLTQTQS